MDPDQRRKHQKLQRLLSAQHRDSALESYRLSSKDNGGIIEPYGSLDPDLLIVGYLTEVSWPLLLGICEQVGVDADTLFFTDIFKHDRQHRRATDREMGRVMYYLDREIEILEPKVVVIIGDQNLETFVGDDSVKDTDGAVLDYGTYWMVPMPYPTTGLVHRLDQARHALTLAAGYVDVKHPRKPRHIEPVPYTPSTTFLYDGKRSQHVVTLYKNAADQMQYASLVEEEQV